MESRVRLRHFHDAPASSAAVSVRRCWSRPLPSRRPSPQKPRRRRSRRPTTTASRATATPARRGPTAGRWRSSPRTSRRRFTAWAGSRASTATPTSRRRPSFRTRRSCSPRSAPRATTRPSPRTTRACTPRRGASGGNLAAAACADCHGSHDIKPSADPDSRTHHLRLLDTCGRCHGNEEIIKRGKIAIGNVVDLFRDSIHGKALIKSGLSVAPTCTDCHGSHDIRRKTDPASRVFRKTIPATCSSCHEGIGREYLGERPRDAGREGQPAGAGLHELPHGARHPPLRRGGLEARGHQGVRHLPRAVAQDLPRHVPRPGDGTRVHARRLVRRLPRRARHLPEGRRAIDRVRRRTSWRPARSATTGRPRASRSSTRTRTRTTASGTRCSSTRRSS